MLFTGSAGYTLSGISSSIYKGDTSMSEERIKRLLFILKLKYTREVSPKIKHRIWNNIQELQDRLDNIQYPSE